MRVIVDACVLYPTLLREIVLGCAARELYTPLWSERILGEWRHAVLRRHPEQAGEVAAEIAAAQARYPGASVLVDASTEARLSLPDDDDRHVLAAAIDGDAVAILTLNLRDFPGRTLAREGLTARAPDSLLMEWWEDAPVAVAEVVLQSLATMRAASGSTASDRALLKRAGLPRLGKALA